MQRRKFLQQSTIAGLGLPTIFHSPFSFGNPLINEVIDLSGKLPVQQFTTGPHQHWFGYYDKQQVSASGRYALSNQVDLFFRSPTPQDSLQVGLIDLENNNQ